MARLKRTAMSDHPVSSNPVAKKARVEAAAEADDAPEDEAAGVPSGEADLANGGEGEVELQPRTEEEERVDQAIDGLAAVQHELEQVRRSVLLAFLPPVPCLICLQQHAAQFRPQAALNVALTAACRSMMRPA